MGRWESGYQKLVVWQEARKLVVLVYRLTEQFPRSEEFGLKSQIRRAAVSVLTNIAEGWLRRSAKDKIHYLEIAEGSLLEIETEGIVARDVQLWTEKHFEEFSEQRSKVAFLLFRYKKSIQT